MLQNGKYVQFLIPKEIEKKYKPGDADTIPFLV